MQTKALSAEWVRNVKEKAHFHKVERATGGLDGACYHVRVTETGLS